MIELEVTVLREYPVDEPDSARIESIVAGALAAEDADGVWSVAVVLVDDAEMQRLHRDFMAIDEPTDILTFPYDPEFNGGVGGDLVISVDTAREQGAEHGNTVAQEIEFLVVHGVLHLLDWGDSDPDDRARMLIRQTEILNGL